MHKIDLHFHSHYSDGKSDCGNLIKLALKNKLEIISVTDHDTLESQEEVLALAGQFSIPCITGVEISTNVEDMLHILGYRIDLKDEKFHRFVALCRKKRFERIEKIINSINKHGIKIELNDVLDLVKSSPSRVHIADVLVEKKYAFSRGDAFMKFLLPSSPTYAGPDGPDVTEAISAIKQVGGIAVLAHPGVIKNSYNLPKWVCSGLEGIEAFYPKHSKTQTQNYVNLADKYGLISTAGSDFHGPGGGFSDNPGIKVTQNVYDTIKNKFLN